jgi:O-antigen/teichoic acid export membrane protein
MSGWIKNLWKDSLVYGIGYGVSRFLQIIILPIIAKALTLSEFGYYSNYVIFYSFVGGLMIFGLDSAVTRFFFDSEDKIHHRKLFSSAFYFILCLSGLTTLAFYYNIPLLLDVLKIPAYYSSSAIYSISCIPLLAINGFLLTWFKWRRQKMYFLINSGGGILLLLLPLLFVSKVSFLYVFQVLFFSQLFIAVISTFLASDYLRFYVDGKLLGSLLKYGFPWMLVFFFGASRSYLDRAFLTQYLDDDTYGLYNFSIRISTLLSLVITAFDMSFGPLAFSIWDKPGAKIFFARLQGIYTLLICSIACAITIVSPLIIQLLGGEKYNGAEKILPILLFAAIPLSLINFSNLGTAYAKKSFLSTVSLFAGFASVLLFNLLLTKHYLQYGATTASLLGHLIIIVTGYYFSARYYSIPFGYMRDGVIFLLFFLLSLAVVNLPMPGFILKISIQLFILTVIILILLQKLFKEEFHKILSFLGRIRQ